MHVHPHPDHSHALGGAASEGASDCHGLHDAHGHHHSPASFGRAFVIGITLNLAFVVIEAAAGFLYG